jgi:MazG family protein
MEEKLKELWDVVVRLRLECPWDREQTHESMRRFLIEEAYEAVEAISEKDDQALKEELGDILLHVFFHARMAEERGAFGVEDVADHVVEKLKRRHPHVFGGAEVSGAAEVITNWETIKCREEDGRLLLDGIPKSLPAMLRAHRIQDRARSVGFEWEDARGVLDKIEEEVGELKRELERRDPERLRAEMGDLLFSLVNLCRYLDLEPGEALNVTNDEFVRRFHAMQAALAAEGLELADATLEQMEEKWQAANKD